MPQFPDFLAQRVAVVPEQLGGADLVAPPAALPRACWQMSRRSISRGVTRSYGPRAGELPP